MLLNNDFYSKFLLLDFLVWFSKLFIELQNTAIHLILYYDDLFGRLQFKICNLTAEFNILQLFYTVFFHIWDFKKTINRKNQFILLTLHLSQFGHIQEY